MTTATMDDIRDVALSLDDVLKASPQNYYFVKGFIHGLLQKAAPDAGVGQIKRGRPQQRPTPEQL